MLNSLLGVALAQKITLSSDKGNGIEQTYNLDYSRRHETSISGTVAGKVKGDPRNGIAESVSLLVRSHGRIYQVDLGPSWYVAQQATSILLGDKIRVVGEPVTIRNGKTVEKVVIARLIIKSKRVLALRDLNGVPYWSAYRKGHVAVAGSGNSISGEIVAVTTVDAENQKQLAYQLKTANGLLNVAVAPNWYLEQQNLGFHMGDNVTVYTGVGPAQFGNVILANGIYANGGTFVLRPNGTPVWSGWGNYIGN